MFSNRSKFHSEFFASRRGVGLVLAFVALLSVVTGLATTLSVLNSQSSPLVQVGFSVTEKSDFEGTTGAQIPMSGVASIDWELTLDIETHTANFEFGTDATNFIFSQDGAGSTAITSFPFTVEIVSSTRSMNLTFDIVNDELIEPDQSFTLKATSSTEGVAIDSPGTFKYNFLDTILRPRLSLEGPPEFSEGQFTEVGVGCRGNTLDCFVQQFHKDLSSSRSDVLRVVVRNAAGEEVSGFDFDIAVNVAPNVHGVDILTGTVNLGPQAETDWNGDQTYTVELVSNSPIIIPAGPAVMYTVNDNDEPMVTLEVADGGGAGVDEGESVDLRVRLTNAPNGAPENLTVNLTTGDLTMATSSDYSFPSSVTIEAGQTSASVKVIANRDLEDDLGETLVIRVGDLNYGANTVTASAPFEEVSLVIVNTPPPTAGFDSGAVLSGAEGTSKTFEIQIDELYEAVRLRLSLATSISASLTGVEIDATVQGGPTNEPITMFPYEFEVGPNNMSTTWPITVAFNEDTFYEGPEGFTLVLEKVSGPVILGSVTSRRVIVQDDDNVAYDIDFQSGPLVLNEGSDVDLTLSITNSDMDGLAADQTVSLSDINGITLPTAVTILASETSVNFTASRANDNFWTGNKDVTVRTTSGGGSLVVPVIDDEQPIFTITAADGSDPFVITEGETNTGNLSLAITNLPPGANLFGATTFRLRRGSTSTVEMSDMINFDTEVTIAEGSASADFAINALADGIFDPGVLVLEVYQVESAVRPVTPLTPASIEVVITDPNPPLITFTTDIASVAEGNTVALRVAIPTALGSDLVLAVSTTALTRVSIDDVDMTPDELTIMAGQTSSAAYMVGIVDDDEVEIDELLALEITELRYRGGISRNMDGTALANAGFTIISDDIARLSLSAESTVMEGSGLTVTITSDKPLPRLANPPTLAILQLNSNGDIVSMVTVLTSSPLYSGMLTDIVTIPNPHDDLFELDQVYTVQLGDIPDALPFVDYGDASLNYTVTDDPGDEPDITLDYNGETTVSEGGVINARITVTNAPDTGLGEELFVKLAFDTSKTTVDSDEISSPLTDMAIRIAPGMRSSEGVVAITVNTDDAFDPGEVFALLVESVWTGGTASVPGAIRMLGTVDAGDTIRIVDTNGPALTLTRVGSGDVEEAAVDEIFNVVLEDGAVATDLILNLAFGGSADHGTDHSAPPTVTIPAGQTSVAYTITVLADADAEFDETVILSISGGVTGDNDMFATPAPQPMAGFTITNDDFVVVTLTGPATTLSEADDPRIDITLSRPLPPDVLGLSPYVVNTFSSSNFEDISSATGVYIFPNWDVSNPAISIDPNEAYLRNLDFEFEFYGVRYSAISVHTNGFIGFTGDPDDLQHGGNSNIFNNRHSDDDSTPAVAGKVVPIAAPLWGALDPRHHASVQAETTPVPFVYGARLGANTDDDRYIIQWSNARVRLSATDRSLIGVATFQVVLYANGRIEFRYDDVPSEVQDATKIGISNGTGTGMAEEFSYRDSKLSSTDTSRIVYDYAYQLGVIVRDEAGRQVGVSNLLNTIGVGETMATINVPVVNNDDWEADRTFRSEASVSNLPFVNLGSPITYTVEDDNDIPRVVLERVIPGSDPIMEGRSVELRARLDNTPKGAPENLIVGLRLSTGTVTTLGTSEYNFPATVTIPRDASEVKFRVNINQDNLLEFDEILAIEVDTLVYGGSSVTPPTRGNIAITARSDDLVGVTITVPDGPEGSMVTARITLDRLLPPETLDGALALVLMDGSLTNNDVTIATKDIAAALKTGRSTDVTIQLKEDTLLEGDETVELMLQIDSTKMPDLAGILPSASASFKIIDNEGGMVEIVPPSVSEYYESVGGNNVQDQMIDFELVLDLPSGVTTDIPVIVHYEIVAPTGLVTVSAAGLGTGFAKGLALPVRGLAQIARLVRSETIPAGQKMAVLTIQLNEDKTPEVTEKLTVRLLSVSTNSAEPLIQRNPGKMQTEITVLDDDEPAFEIIGDGEIDEDDGTYPVRLRRLGRLTHNGMAVNEIEFEIVGDGADEGDFVGPLTGRKFTFSGNNALSDPILLPLDDDNSEEGEKTFEIRVYAPGASTPLAAPIVDSSGARFTSITLFDSDVSFSGDLPATGGPVLPVWLLLTLALTGVVLLVPTLRRLI